MNNNEILFINLKDLKHNFPLYSVIRFVITSPLITETVCFGWMTFSTISSSFIFDSVSFFLIYSKCLNIHDYKNTFWSYRRKFSVNISQEESLFFGSGHVWILGFSCKAARKFHTVKRNRFGTTMMTCARISVRVIRRFSQISRRITA